ncbi:DUF6635 family protein [Microvirga aerilata]|uniref:DUF6635 family protein n=1 Tax=Microvirga aerilata TaxID=670292 RepID=UPI00362B0127
MNPSPEVLLSRADAQRIVADGARRYFESRRARVDDFVDRHFSFTGSVSMHRKAVGWDMLKAPANIALAVPQLAAKLAAAGAKAVGADRVSEYLGSRKLVFDTEVGNEIEWLIITDLLELPFQQGERVFRRDALADTILAAPELQERLHDALGAIGRKGDDAVFRERLEESLETYAGTRAAAAEIATSLMTVGAGALAVHQVTPGVMSLGPALAAALAQNAAVASFPLGAGAGGLWYGLFPAAVSPCSSEV